MPLPLDTRATTTETPKATKEEPPGKDDMRAFEHFPNLVTMFFARAAEKGDAPLFVAEERGAMAFPELGGNGAASGSTGRRVARQWAAARRHSDARFGKSPGI